MGLHWNENQYVVVYCCLKGDATDRDQLSQELYRHVRVVREVIAMGGRGASDIADLRQELGGMFRRSGLAGRMDEVLFSFTIFDRHNPTVTSGHFGGARPAVIGSENKVTAYNQVPIQLRDGRDVRYWEVEANMESAEFYLLSYDTSKIAAKLQNSSITSKRGAQTNMTKNVSVKIDAIVAPADLPRYYLSITRMAEEGSQQPPSALPKPA